jgi:hypothetical protein
MLESGIPPAKGKKNIIHELSKYTKNIAHCVKSYIPKSNSLQVFAGVLRE